MLDLVGLGRARQHQRVTALLEGAEQVAGAIERRGLTDQLAVLVPLGGADVVALPPLDLRAGDRLDELVGAHPDMPVDTPDRKGDVVPPKGPVPRDRVVIVGVDQRAVDAENGSRWHERLLVDQWCRLRLPGPPGR
jgi:hypothetical protein